MVLSTNPLSSDLISSLVAFTATFQSTANSFLANSAVRDTEFSRVCELHNTLDILSSSREPIGVLERLTGNASAGEYDAVKAAQELLGFMLNAEFVLFEAYRQYGLRVNPSLAHWVEVCRDFEKYVHKNPSGQWGVREKVLKIRVAFVKGILGEQGVRLASISPHDFATKGLDFTVDIDSFKGALQEQGIYDEVDHDAASSHQDGTSGSGGFSAPIGSGSRSIKPHLNTNADTGVGGSGHSSASGLTSGAQSPSFLVMDAQAETSSYLVRATTEELRPNVTNSILSTLKSNPSLLNLYPLDFISSATLANLVSCNPILARGIVMLLLHQQQGSTTQRRGEVLTALTALPASLHVLEMLNILITQTQLLTKDEISHLLHEFLANAIRSTEAMVAITPLTADIPSGIYGSGGKRAQSRQIQLLCLFLQSLLRTGGIDVADVYYQVQDLGVRFMYVKEARELWKVICG